MVTAPSKWALIRPFFLILALHCLAIYLFTRGFLLTRTELSAYSHCSDLSQPDNPCSFSPHSKPEPQPDAKCWTRPAVDRLVIIILDALRFDFVAPSTFFEEKKPWMDKLRVLQRLASGEGAAGRIFKAIADPPTTSLQRLKGLTTGGLPTFIDVGNSFGAPAIVEDNLLFQLVRSGKRVLMMGDDTWMQLFPDHFERSYPYPSFNVKDLDTVDNGCIEHLLPSLYKEDWDVLIAHFLGVDHAGHIFGVDSIPMMQKLEQYNNILEEVVGILQNQSGPGGLHENTLFLVLGDHGQTLNGDHGGGTAEEVETSLYAMSLSSSPASASSILDKNFCKLDLDGRETCISTIQQLDFAATVAALLGIPFPFGSIGRVNPELYALSGGTWSLHRSSAKNCNWRSNLEAWMQNYVNALCVNCWQVKRYIDFYSTMSVIGLPEEDMHHVSELYNQAQGNWSNVVKSACLAENETLYEGLGTPLSILQKQVNAYSNFLESVAKLARSAWTEFDLKLMGAGLAVMLVSLLVHLSAIRHTTIECQSYYHLSSIPGVSIRLIFVLLLVVIRGASFLSNSYILTEGSVASFLLATTGMLNLYRSINTGKVVIEDFGILILNILLRFGIEFGISKHTAGPTSLNSPFVGIPPIDKGYTFWLGLWEIFPIIVLSLIALLMFKYTSTISNWSYLKLLCLLGTVLSYMLIAVYWISDSNLMAIPTTVQDIGKTIVPKLVYAIGFALLVQLAIFRIFCQKRSTSDSAESLPIATMAMISAWSSTILILLGSQGAFVALICISGAWCIIKSQKLVGDEYATNVAFGGFFNDPISIVQWSLLAVCLFFYTGHWCAFDGLRYGAAFVGFEQFNIIRQGLLLTIDTFGVSHILPIISLPFLVSHQCHTPPKSSTQPPTTVKPSSHISEVNSHQHQTTKKKRGNDVLFFNLTQVFLIYGLIPAVTTTFTVICVAIQRRHLMVWGLFAPKYVFDALGLLLTDVLICFTALFYY